MSDTGLSKTARQAAEAAQKGKKQKIVVEKDQGYPLTAPLANGGIYYFQKEPVRTIRMRAEEIPAFLETLQEPLLSKVTKELETRKEAA